MNKNTFVILLALLIVTTLFQAIVIVRDTEKAILLKLGAFERTMDPGLNFKVPFVDSVIKFEGRLRSLDTPPDRVLSSEAKPLNVDSFVKYKIVDAETYYTSTNGGQDRVAEDTLQRRIKDKLRNEFGKRTFDKSHFNLPLQFGVLSFSTKYRLTGNLKTEETGTKVTFKLKNDPYWTAINCVTPIIILVLLISNRSTPSIVVSGFIITAFLIRWVSTSNNFERIESELKNILNR